MMRFLVTIFLLFYTIEAKDINPFLQTIISIYEKELKDNPNSIELKEKLGFAYFNNREYDKAAKLYKELIELNRNKNYYDKLILCYLKSGDGGKAKEYLLKKLSKSKDRYKDALSYGDMLFGFGYSKEAIEFYKIALNKKEESKIYLQLAYCYNDITKYNEAIDMLNRALKLEPNSTDIEGALLFSYFLKGDTNTTLKLLKKIEDRGINNPSEYASSIFIYTKLKEYKKALALAKKQLNRYKSDYAYIDIIRVYLAQKRYKEVLLLLGELNKKNYYRYAYVYNFINKNYNQAKKDLDILMKIEPNSFSNYINLMEFELVSKGKISKETKDKTKALIENEGDRVQYNMLLLLEEIYHGKVVDLDKLKEWREVNIDGYGNIVFWDFMEINEWVSSQKDSKIRSNLELAVKFFEGKVK